MLFFNEPPGCCMSTVTFEKQHTSERGYSEGLKSVYCRECPSLCAEADCCAANGLQVDQGNNCLRVGTDAARTWGSPYRCRRPCPLTPGRHTDSIISCARCCMEKATECSSDELDLMGGYFPEKD